MPFAAGLVVLDASLSFGSLWPTPVIRWSGQLSVECAVLVVALALAWHLRGRPPAWALRLAGGFWTVLALGRYAAVTSTALFGRDINLYWDSRHFSAVGAMLARVASPLELAGVALAAVAIPLAVYALLRWAARPRERGDGAAHRRAAPSPAGCLVVIALFAVERLTMQPDATPRSCRRPSRPPTCGRRAWWPTCCSGATPARSAKGRRCRPSSRPSTAPTSWWCSSSRTARSPTTSRRFRARSRRGARASKQQVHASGLDVVSGFVESPTFGGSSWLAHVSFLTGVEVKDEGTNVRLMAQKRRTLVTALGGRGYRTVAVMPGLQEHWPEGAFYGFDRIYGTQQLAYTGPSFGWWPIPDQFALAQLEHLELAPKDRAPVFAFLPTTSTHTPFSPTPPYQASWPRMLTPTAVRRGRVSAGVGRTARLAQPGPELHALDGLRAGDARRLRRLPRTRDVVLILIGDHQPPAVVSGEGAPWDVPVHVVSSRRAFLDALTAQGFSRGMHPRRAPLMRLHELMPALTSAMAGDPGVGDSVAAAASAVGGVDHDVGRSHRRVAASRRHRGGMKRRDGRRAQPQEELHRQDEDAEVVHLPEHGQDVGDEVQRRQHVEQRQQPARPWRRAAREAPASAATPAAAPRTGTPSALGRTNQDDSRAATIRLFTNPDRRANPAVHARAARGCATPRVRFKPVRALADSPGAAGDLDRPWTEPRASRSALAALVALAGPRAVAAPEHEALTGRALAGGKPAADVVVWLDAPDRRRARSERRFVMRQRNMEFVPRVLAAPVGLHGRAAQQRPRVPQRLLVHQRQAVRPRSLSRPARASASRSIGRR